MAQLDREPNAGRAWTASEIEALRQLIRDGVPTRLIADRLGRSEYAVRAKASQARISFRGEDLGRASKKPR